MTLVIYSALSSPMNILSTFGCFWVNEISRDRQSGGLESYTLIKIFVRFPCFINNADISAYAGLRVKCPLEYLQV